MDFADTTSPDYIYTTALFAAFLATNTSVFFQVTSQIGNSNRKFLSCVALIDIVVAALAAASSPTTLTGYPYSCRDLLASSFYRGFYMPLVLLYGTSLLLGEVYFKKHFRSLIFNPYVSSLYLLAMPWLFTALLFLPNNRSFCAADQDISSDDKSRVWVIFSCVFLVTVFCSLCLHRITKRSSITVVVMNTPVHEMIDSEKQQFSTHHIQIGPLNNHTVIKKIVLHPHNKDDNSISLTFSRDQGSSDAFCKQKASSKVSGEDFKDEVEICEEDSRSSEDVTLPHRLMVLLCYAMMITPMLMLHLGHAMGVLEEPLDTRAQGYAALLICEVLLVRVILFVCIQMFNVKGPVLNSV